VTVPTEEEERVDAFVCLHFPPHPLAASDQLHQHIHRRRFVVEQKLRIETNSVLHREDKVECLLESVTQCTDMCSLMRTAFYRAGISRELRSITLLKNQPEPDSEPLAPLSRTQSASLRIQ